MMGMKLPARARARGEAEKPFWISFADLMTALMVLFLISVTVALFAVTQKPDELAKRQAQREHDIQALLGRISDAAGKYPDIVVRGNSIDFGARANFETGKSALSVEQAEALRAFVPELLSVVRNPSGQLKRIVVEGYADQRGSYLYNLNLSLQRAERVLCVLLAKPGKVKNALSDEDRLQVRELFLVGGSSFNAQKASLEESRRIELKLEFLELDEKRQTPRDAPLDDAPCPLDS